MVDGEKDRFGDKIRQKEKGQEDEYFARRERLSRAQRLAIEVLAVCLMLGVGWARIMRHAHWPSDVLGGFVLGICCAAAAAWWETSRSEATTERRTLGEPPEGGPATGAPGATC